MNRSWELDFPFSSTYDAGINYYAFERASIWRDGCYVEFGWWTAFRSRGFRRDDIRNWLKIVIGRATPIVKIVFSSFIATNVVVRSAIASFRHIVHWRYWLLLTADRTFATTVFPTRKFGSLTKSTGQVRNAMASCRFLPCVNVPSTSRQCLTALFEKRLRNRD